MLLEHERTGTAGVADRLHLGKLREQAARSVRGAAPLAEDHNFMRKIAAVELKALEFTELRTLATLSAGKARGRNRS